MADSGQGAASNAITWSSIKAKRSYGNVQLVAAIRYFSASAMIWTFVNDKLTHHITHPMDRYRHTIGYTLPAAATTSCHNASHSVRAALCYQSQSIESGPLSVNVVAGAPMDSEHLLEVEEYLIR